MINPSIYFNILINFGNTFSKKNRFQNTILSFTPIKLIIASIKIYFLPFLNYNSTTHFSPNYRTITPNALLTVTLSLSLAWNNDYLGYWINGWFESSSMFCLYKKITGQFFIDRRHFRIVYGVRYGNNKDMTELAYELVTKSLDK